MKLIDPTPHERAMADIRKRWRRGEPFTCFSAETMDAALLAEVNRLGLRLERYGPELWIVHFPARRCPFGPVSPHHPRDRVRRRSVIRYRDDVAAW